LSAIVTFWITVSRKVRAENGVQKIRHEIISVWRGTILHKPPSSGGQFSCHDLGYKDALDHTGRSMNEEIWQQRHFFTSLDTQDFVGTGESGYLRRTYGYIFLAKVSTMNTRCSIVNFISV
jgi:hypothetical protein